ncbi:TetR/AcrR family transcriptional regulator [Paenibacillus sp. P96]|uniref:TetR/AcrR family transcriptional regulator n=1 Tax=Paenibacillus zeirhizosphaerae TaxID=2987519 RepID=A0ABT9FMR1_9BACL|nr:TetR/AcrR family transcriptional regulator [Paenibacillus sp. P96]MDP4096007.1 TetR/AcrR family transcriptional regulator [Paenibacillus sp. P96]
MARNKEFDTTLVLHKAMEIFGHYGYEGTSLKVLLEGLGIARQSLYDTYGTKRDLFVKAVTHYTNQKSCAVITYLEQADSVNKAIHDIFHEVAATLKDEQRRKECLILYSAIDQVPHDPEIADLFEQDRVRLEQAIYDALVRAEHQGELRPGQDLHTLARYLYYARYGLIQVSKLTSDPKVLDEIVTVTLSAIDK